MIDPKIKNNLIETISKQCTKLAKENKTLKAMLASCGINCASCAFCGWCNFTYTEKQDIEHVVCTKWQQKTIKKVNKIESKTN